MTSSGTSSSIYSSSVSSSSVASSSCPSSPRASLGSPLGFLQAALPHIPTETLEAALADAETTEDGSIDIERVVNDVLTLHFIEELQEAESDALPSENPVPQEYPTWQPAKPKKAGKKKPPKHKDGQKLVFGDVLQRNRRPQPQSHDSSAPQPLPPPDPWTQLASLCDYLAQLIPTHRSEFFRSQFHSDKFDTPATALRTALHSVCQSLPECPDPEDIDNQMLFRLLDVILALDESEDYSLSAGDHSQLVSDVQLALTATQGQTDSALDVFWLMSELDCDMSSGQYSRGLYHAPSSPPPSTPISPSPSIQSLPQGPPASPLPALYKHHPSKQTSPSSHKPSPYQWQKVPARQLNKDSPHAAFIPAYQRRDGTSSYSSLTSRLPKVGASDRISISQEKAADNMQKSNELLREASRMWQKGRNKSYGGEVALYFAERARVFQEAARQEALNAARLTVESTRVSSKSSETIDLHGTTAQEAIVIVREILDRSPPSAQKPLKIITGKGTHSANQTGVLKPALRKSLLSHGWSVTSWDSGLTIRGRIS